MTASHLTDARQSVAAALAAADIGVPVHAAPPATLAAPCVVVAPGTDWVAARNIELDVIVYANTAGGAEAALTRLEETLTKVREALWSAQILTLATPAPTPSDTGHTLAAVVPVALRSACR